MNSLGVSSETRSKSSAPVSRSLVSAVTPWAFTRIRLRIVRPIGISARPVVSGFSISAPRAEEKAHSQRKEQDVAPLDDQRLGSVSTGHQLSPEDRVGPRLAIMLRGSGDPTVRAPGHVQPGCRRFLARQPDLAGSRAELFRSDGHATSSIKSCTILACGRTCFDLCPANRGSKSRRVPLRPRQSLDSLGFGSLPKLARLVLARVPHSKHPGSERDEHSRECQPAADVDHAGCSHDRRQAVNCRDRGPPASHDKD